MHSFEGATIPRRVLVELKRKAIHLIAKATIQTPKVVYIMLTRFSPASLKGTFEGGERVETPPVEGRILRITNQVLTTDLDLTLVDHQPIYSKFLTSGTDCPFLKWSEIKDFVICEGQTTVIFRI